MTRRDLKCNCVSGTASNDGKVIHAAVRRRQRTVFLRRALSDIREGADCVYAHRLTNWEHKVVCWCILCRKRNFGALFHLEGLLP